MSMLPYIELFVELRKLGYISSAREGARVSGLVPRENTSAKLFGLALVKQRMFVSKLLACCVGT